MDDLDYVLNIIDSWLNKYIEGGAEQLSSMEKLGVGIWILDTEVNNGGFDQYYLNSRGVLAEETVLALKKIGAPETACLLEAANRDIPTLPLPEDRDERNLVLENVREGSRFGALETEYYQERENRISLLAKYLSNYAKNT